MLWTFLVCLGLALLFPKSFKFWTGTIVGLFFGGLAWGLFAMVGGVHTYHQVLPSLGAFLIGGIVLGCVFAARG